MPTNAPIIGGLAFYFWIEIAYSVRPKLSTKTHCSNPKKVLNENDTPQFLQFPFVYTLERQNWSL